MKNIILYLGLALCFSVLSGIDLSYPSSLMSGHQADGGRLKAQYEIRLKMRGFWEDELQWVRSYIVSTFGDLEDYDYIEERLFMHQSEIAEILRQYIGADNAVKLSDLLKEHVSSTVEFINAIRLGNDGVSREAKDRRHKNIEEITAFLSGANPYWQKEMLSEMLYEYAENITGQITSRAKRSWEQDYDYYEKSRVNIRQIADFLSDGLVKQFPNVF